MSSKKPAASPDASLTAPVPAKSRKPRTIKPKQPAWYRAEFPDGRYRIIEASSAEAVFHAIAKVSSATPQDFVQAGKDGVMLESKQVQAADSAES